ncbi:MAG: TonB-dependent receptor [Xanthomonadales bacterium]|nr:TonB-dependent receptor [Xanthomonadales bacterium]
MNKHHGFFAILLLAFQSSAVIAQGVLEEILVTATKREMNLQDVPLSIEVATGEHIENFRIVDLTDLSASIPNFTVGENLTMQSITMRGFGSGQERSFEQSVGMFIDGIYMPRGRQYRGPFLDIERVEVVRGPQAVLFGLNSTAGAVSIVNRRTRPGDAFTADLTADYELEYGGPSATVVMGGSPHETLGLRIAAQVTEREGFFENATSGRDEQDMSQQVLRISGIWEPSDKVSVDAKYEYASYDVDDTPGEAFGTPATNSFEPNDGVLNWRNSPDLALITAYGDHAFRSGNEAGVFAESHNLSAKVDIAIGENTLTLLGGYTELDYDMVLDVDRSPVPFLAGAIEESYDQTSFEARFESATGGRFEYLVGAYYQESQLYNANITIQNLAARRLPFPPGNNTSYYDLDSDLWSTYAQGTYNFHERARVTAGLRYVDESKSVERNRLCGVYLPDVGFVPSIGTPPNASCPNALSSNGFMADRSSEHWMPEIIGQWDVDENNMFYAKWASSDKGGGFASDTNIGPNGVEFDDESATGYEVGLKSTVADGRGQLNLAFFYTEFDDLQVKTSATVNLPNGGVTFAPIVGNAAKASSEGVEINGTWAVTEALTMGASFAILNAQYDEFNRSSCNSANAATADPVSRLCDLGGQELPYAPDWSGNVFADFEQPINSALVFKSGVQVSFSDEYFTNPTLDPIGLQDGWTRVDLRLGVAAADDLWSVMLIGRNITDEAVLGGSTTLLGYAVGYLEPPRTVLIEGRYRFGK